VAIVAAFTGVFLLQAVVRAVGFGLAGYNFVEATAGFLGAAMIFC